MTTKPPTPTATKPAKPRRVITPHKGGRTVLISACRATPETKERLREILRREGLSLGDLMEQVVKERD